ncbi:polyADP-ribose polymerase PARP14 [Crotalus adamanteus]|uniref:Poly [ADP-ribose] polymerase n=1 Tax=Crotalus adamanteus TaxID=8729 RepID=A0AAW1B7M4_CROAD
MNEEFKMGPSSPVRRGELQVVSDEKVPSRLRHENPIRKTSETTELLFITLAEQRLWKQLLGILSPSLWEVKVSAALQSDSPVISFTGSPEVVPRAKETISKLLILVGSQVQVNRIDVPHLKAAGFFQLQKGSHLFLWEGEASHIRADAVVRIGTNGGLDSGNAVFAQRVWSPERSLYTNLDIHFSCPPTAGLAAGMVKLALEAASRKGFQSVVVTYSGSTISTTEAEVIVLGTEAFRKKHPVDPLKSLHVVSEDRHATMLFYKECQKHWSSGKDDSEKLRNMLLSLESTKIEVATSPDEKKKADVVVLPLVLDPDGLDWGSGVHAITQKALEIVPQCSDLCPGDILSVAGSAFPELGCRMIYLVRFDDLQRTSKEAHKQAIRNMVWSCLSTFYGSFLESIVFPILQPVDAGPVVMWEWLLILLEEVNRFLKNFPNTWMKLVQIRPLPGWILPCPIEDSVCFAAEPVGLCHMEEPLFLQYLEENSSAFNEFQVQLKKAGYDIQIDFDWRLLIFQAINQSMQLLDLEKAFEFVRKKYVLHCETRGEILEVLIDHQRLMKRYKSLRIYILDRMWLVGLLDEVCCFLQCLAQEASQRQLVSWECTAEPLPWYTIAKDVVLQEILPSNPMIKLEIIAKTPATIRFWGPHRRVKEAERRLKELLNTFQILPIPLSNFQLQFVKAHWGKVFYNHFFLERSIPVVLELSQVVQIAGLDLGKMKEAKEILMKLVCERTVDIAEDLKWATECSDWKELLQRLGTHKEVAIHHVAPSWVILVGFYPLVFQAEDSIKEYLRENSPMEEKVRLAGPELALAGKDLLHIMGWERLGMNVAFQVNSQPLVLLVSGLQKYVKKALPAIKKDLDSLAFDIVPLRKRILNEYFSGVGASLLKNMAWPLGCIAGMKTENPDGWNSFINNEDLIKKRFATGFSEAIYVMGKRDPVILLKQNVAGFITKFSTKSIRHEAIATSKNMNIDEFLRSIFHNFPVDIRWLQDDELQICGFQEDVENVLEAVHRKIEKYLSEIIEVKAQYESVPYIVIKKSLFQKRFPTSPFVSTEMLAKDPATIIFRGPRQKLVELRRHFEELFSGFQFLPVSLSELQFQFVKAQWGKLFHDGFFSEKNILAILEISEVVQIGGLSLGELQEAKKLLMEQVCEKTVEIADQLQWVTEETEWEELLNRLKSHKEVAVHYTPPNQVTVVGPSPQAAEIEEYIKEHLRDNSPLKESMMLTRSELVLAGGESLLHIMDWEHLKVNIKFKPSNCRLSLQVKGLRKFVKEAIPVIKKDLDSLMFGMIPLKKKTLCIYFSEDGADLLKNMAEAQNCIVKMQTQGSHNSSNGTTRSNGEVLQDLAEDHRAVIHVVGIRSEVTSLKQHLSDFIAKFHKKTICSAELSTFSNDSLKALCEAVSPQYPVVFHRLTEKVVWLCGSQEDVENVSGKIYTKLEEVLVAKIEKAQAEHTDSKLLYETIRWHHRSDAGWSTFDMLTNRYLEQAYSEKKTEALVPWDGQKLAINFLTGEAFMPSKKKIRIRREICLWDKNIAPYWEAMDGLVKKVELQAHSKEYQDVVKNFNKTAGNYNVVKVERIQNRYLWVSYCWKKSWMEKRNPEGTKNELILYHGTLSENCSSVCEIGFKNAFRKQSLYGQGIYFSVAAGRAVYYAKPDPQGLRYVFQARVLTGEYGCGKENMVLPPAKQEGNGRYDSLVDVLSKPNIFVVFFDDHAYPEYLITFRGMTSS